MIYGQEGTRSVQASFGLEEPLEFLDCMDAFIFHLNSVVYETFDLAGVSIRCSLLAM